MFKEMKFDDNNNNYHKVKEYFNNNDKLRGKAGMGGSCMIYLNNLNNPIILERRGTINHYVGIISLLEKDSRFDEIKKNIEEIIKN